MGPPEGAAETCLTPQDNNNNDNNNKINKFGKVSEHSL